MEAEGTHAEEAVDRFLPRLPATLYEVAWQYSLFDWYDSVQSGTIDFDLSPSHLAYLTPRAKSELFGEPDSLVVVSVDLSDPEEPKLGENDGSPVEVTTYTEADRFRVGHAYPANKTSSMTDYSVTTHKSADAHHIAGLRDDAWGTNNVVDRFTGWAQSEYADAVRDRVDGRDAAVLDGLASLGDDEEAMSRLSDALIEAVGDEETELDSLITIRVLLPDEDEYRFPGEIPVLNEVMVEKKAERLENISVDDAAGDGTGFVTGEETRVTGGSPGLFDMYGKKQREHFGDLDTSGGSAWRNRPLDLDVAASIAAANSIFEDFYRSLGNNRRLYVLPYLATRRADLTASQVEWFYETVFEPLRTADDDFDDVVENIMRKSSGAEESADREPTFGKPEETAYWDDVRIAAVHQVSGNPSRVFFDTLDASYRPAELEDAHNTVLQRNLFRGDGIFADYPSPDSSPLLGNSLDLHRSILYGSYFDRTTEPTRASNEASETPTAGDIDDYRMKRVRRFLTGEPILAADLLDHYLNDLVQEQQNSFGSDADYIPVPVRSIVEQYVQLHALAETGALETETISLTFDTSEMDTEPTSRKERLEQTLENHEALSEEYQEAPFILGALVGRVTAYQNNENISSTLVRRYPIDYLTKQTIQEVTKEVLQKDADYAEAEERRNYWTNSRFTERLPDAMLTAHPDDWPITDAELQWLYGLGIAYGLNDTAIEENDGEDAAEATAAAADQS